MWYCWFKNLPATFGCLVLIKKKCYNYICLQKTTHSHKILYYLWIWYWILISYRHHQWIDAINIKYEDLLLVQCALNRDYPCRNKVELVKDFILENNINICALTETWLSKFHEPITQQLQPDGYKLLHEDHNAKSGGGVAVLCKCSTYPVLSSEAKFTSFESINIKLKIHQTVRNLIVIYWPPSLPRIPTSVFINEFSQYLEEIVISPGKSLIVGRLQPPCRRSKETISSILHWHLEHLQTETTCHFSNAC